MSFMTAFGENNGSLKFLKISIRAGRHTYEILQALADALLENNGLVELSVRAVSSAPWIRAVQAISTHSTLRKLDISFLDFPVVRDEEASKRRQTRAVAEMLVVNTQVEDIKFYDSVYDRSIWDTGIVPRLEYNIYRKRFRAIQKVDVSTRAAILGAAMSC
jgi:hypothetical protein